MNDRLNFRFYYKGYTHSHADSKNEPAGYCTSRISKSSGRTLYYNPKSNVGYFLDQLLDSEDHDKEQCTGLRDKNGTLIYENDRVLVRIFDENKQKYIDIKCTVVWLSARNGWALYSTDCKIISDLYFQSRQIEIIGNTRNKGTITSYGANSI